MGMASYWGYGLRIASTKFGKLKFVGSAPMNNDQTSKALGQEESPSSGMAIATEPDVQSVGTVTLLTL